MGRYPASGLAPAQSNDNSAIHAAVQEAWRLGFAAAIQALREAASESACRECWFAAARMLEQVQEHQA
jgi:hypothetical protein